MTSPDTSKPKILVVDDEPDNLDLLFRTFYREFKVLRAESGPEALDILAQHGGDIAVIISDQRMPSMSGTEFLSLTATQYPDIIRIILTGYTDVEDLVDAINSGKVFKYVTKPWDDRELKGVVRQAVDTHNVLRTRTQELRRTLRQESLLNAVTNTIRQAINYRQILQTIVETVGHMFEVSCCLLRPVQEDHITDEIFIYAAGHDPVDHQELEPESPQWPPMPDVGDRTHALADLHDSAAELLYSDSDSPPTEPPNQVFDWDELMHTVWETEDILVIHNTLSDDRTQRMTPKQKTVREICQEADIQSSLIVPLIWQQNVLALLVLHQCGRSRQWQDDEIQLVCMVADQAAPALAQAHTYEQVKALARREALVNTITAAIRSSLDPQEIFAAITQQLGQALHVDGCALSLWTEEDQFVQCVGLHDAAQQEEQVWSDREEPQDENEMARRLRESGLVALHLSDDQGDVNILTHQNPLPQSQVPIEGNPVLKQVMMTQEPVIIDDLQHHPEMNMPDLPLRSPARALLVVPLIHNGRIIGSISLRQSHSPRQWQPDEVALAQAVAVQAAIAVQQSRLYHTTRQQAEQLMELDRQKNEFFQNVSHEFRTPLTLTIGPLESAVAQSQGLSYDQSQMALRNSRRLLRLVNQLLDLQRLDAGRMQPRFHPCNLRTFVDQIVESFQHYCERKQIHLQTELSDCPEIYIDLEKFDKVLLNLLSNAMKFTSAGGTITVSMACDNDQCIVQVKDTGIGIRADQIPYLFDRFHQADGSTNRKYEGSGLGLALVKKLVEMHGGKVNVDSVYGEGSTFTLWLKLGYAHLPPDQVVNNPTEIDMGRAAIELADIEAETQREPDIPSPATPDIRTEGRDDALNPAEPITSSSPASILVVDDNPDLRLYVSSILERAGYRVVFGRNGAEGLELAQSECPDLIVTDLMMPQVSGIEMIQQLRTHETLKGIPIILLTAKVDEDTRIEGVERGADAYLSKPFNDRELLADVRNLLALKANERRVAELNRYLTESVLQRFLPPALVKKAAQGDLTLDLRPEPKLITILFSDIVGFTQLSNTLRSRRVAELLNEYLNAMTHAIFAHGGTVDKFMGDAILAIFGAPEEIPPNEQVQRAIAAAREMYRALEDLNERWQAQGIGEVKFRCGIHQGTAVVGMFGGAERTDYTAIGPSVNIAARIQEAADADSILVSAAVADYLELTEEAIQKFNPLKLKGVDETVLTFSIKAHPESDRRSILERFDQ